MTYIRKKSNEKLCWFPFIICIVEMTHRHMIIICCLLRIDNADGKIYFS